MGALHTPVGRFVRHYVEMVVAMLVGMGVFWPLWLGLFALLGRPGLSDRADVDAVTMGLDMAFGMALWMRWRRHAWRPVLEMSVAMVLPFVVVLVPHWAGAVDRGGVMAFGHTGMFVTMLAVMLWRRDDYTATHEAGVHQVGAGVRRA